MADTFAPKVDIRRKAALDELLCDRPIAYHPLLAQAVGSVTAGVLLSQFCYWTPRTQNDDGWFYKTQADISAETALSRSEQETARRKLRSTKVVEEQWRGMPAKLHFRVDFTQLEALLAAVGERTDTEPATIPAATVPASEDAGIPQARMQETRKQGRGIPARKPAAIPQAITEITAESTPESSTREVQPSSIRGAFSPDRGDLAGQPDRRDGPTRVRETLLAKGALRLSPLPPQQLPQPNDQPAAQRPGPPPEYIAAVIADIVQEFGDADDIPVNVSQAMALWHQSGVSVQAFVDLVYEVQAAVRTRPSIKNRLAYIFTCLRRALAAVPDDATTASRDRTPRRQATVVWSGAGGPSSDDAVSGPQTGITRAELDRADTTIDSPGKPPS
jgi:hypothetical protein